jgi:hypothetical protein
MSDLALAPFGGFRARFRVGDRIAGLVETRSLINSFAEAEFQSAVRAPVAERRAAQTRPCSPRCCEDLLK